MEFGDEYIDQITATFQSHDKATDDQNIAPFSGSLADNFASSSHVAQDNENIYADQALELR